MASDDATADKLLDAAEAAEEDVWQLPIPAHIRGKLDSQVADLRSTAGGDRAGGALVAAAFLREFVGEDISWAHLDIAGPAWNSGSGHGYLAPAAPDLGSGRWSNWPGRYKSGDCTAGDLITARPLRVGESTQVWVFLVAAVVVTHALRVADHGSVIPGDLKALGELVPPPGLGTTRRVHSPSHATSSSVVRVTVCLRLDERLHPTVAAGELGQMQRDPVIWLRRARTGRAAALASRLVASTSP